MVSFSPQNQKKFISASEYQITQTIFMHLIGVVYLSLWKEKIYQHLKEWKI